MHAAAGRAVVRVERHRTAWSPSPSCERVSPPRAHHSTAFLSHKLSMIYYVVKRVRHKASLIYYVGNVCRQRTCACAQTTLLQGDGERGRGGKVYYVDREARRSRPLLLAPAAPSSEAVCCLAAAGAISADAGHGA